MAFAHFPFTTFSQIIYKVDEAKSNEVSDEVLALRHSIAHFDIEIVSINHSNLIDEIVFKDRKAKGEEYEVVRFCSAELLPFLRYYGGWLMSNLKKREDYR